MMNINDLSQQTEGSRRNAVGGAFLLAQTSLTPSPVIQGLVLLAGHWLQCENPVWATVNNIERPGFGVLHQ